MFPRAAAGIISFRNPGHWMEDTFGKFVGDGKPGGRVFNVLDEQPTILKDLSPLEKRTDEKLTEISQRNCHVLSLSLKKKKASGASACSLPLQRYITKVSRQWNVNLTDFCYTDPSKSQGSID